MFLARRIADDVHRRAQGFYAILGGLDSTGGALVGGLLIGLAETLTQGYQDQLSFLGRAFRHALRGDGRRPTDAAHRPVRHRGGDPCRRRAPGPGAPAAILACSACLVAPFYLDAFWVQVGLAFAAMVAALGLNLLVGEAGQLSLAHSFFIAIGAYGYTLLASPPREAGSPAPSAGPAAARRGGRPSPPPVSAACCSARSPPASEASTSAWPRSASCSSASTCWSTPSRSPAASTAADVPPLTVAGFSFDDVPGETLHVLGVPFTRVEKLWYVGLVATVLHGSSTATCAPAGPAGRMPRCATTARPRRR